MPMPFDSTPDSFQADLVAEFKGDIAGAREAYEIVAKDGWAPAFLEAHRQKHLKLPACSEQAVNALTSEGQSLAQSIVARAVDAR